MSTVLIFQNRPQLSRDFIQIGRESPRVLNFRLVWIAGPCDDVLLQIFPGNLFGRSSALKFHERINRKVFE